MTENLNKLKEQAGQVKKEISQRTISYITAAFAFIAGLAWNEAIKTLIEFLFPIDQNTILAKFIYAVLITFILAIVTIYLVRLLKKSDGSDPPQT